MSIALRLIATHRAQPRREVRGQLARRQLPGEEVVRVVQDVAHDECHLLVCPVKLRQFTHGVHILLRACHLILHQGAIQRQQVISAPVHPLPDLRRRLCHGGYVLRFGGFGNCTRSGCAFHVSSFRVIASSVTSASTSSVGIADRTQSMSSGQGTGIIVFSLLIERLAICNRRYIWWNGGHFVGGRLVQANINSCLVVIAGAMISSAPVVAIPDQVLLLRASTMIFRLRKSTFNGEKFL